jgi:hypothetical protein
MGIDSRWVREHPDWFISRRDPPYPVYTFDGPNLSNDERVGIWLEDHYYDASDAAVVFKRMDRWSGETRYVYHGNDGTSFPWNDTAQIDYLNPEAREAVIRTILAVARRFPVIRFDAAMVLARRHIQRLWYPLPGEGGAIPSRAESAITQEEFDARIPAEFWREVVDRVAAEVPDTLLLAEAFWLLEGYFVRTLGMHRVYNSAFMHMLRDEQNADYRSVIRETVAFDARILGRYVNFMNNPDERTAVDQFGSGDKYVGVATLLATMPGLPMFGHGQVEGFTEKYGMEFRRALLDERPDEDLVARHERDVFPLLRERWRFAGSDRFRLLDARRPDGSVDEDVFAYTNQAWHARSLIVYRNRFADGRVTIPGVADGLAIADEIDRWVLLRDARTGLTYLRSAHDLHAKGLELDLPAYACHVFLDPDEVVDGPDRAWAGLAWRVGLAGIADVGAALEDHRLEPIRAAASELLSAGLLREAAGAAFARTEGGAERLLHPSVGRAREALRGIAQAARADRAEAADGAGSRLEARLRELVAVVRRGRRGGAEATPGERGLARWLGTDRARWGTLLGLLAAESLAAVARATADEPDAVASTTPFDAWGGAFALAEATRGVGLDDESAWRVVALVRAQLALPAGALAADAEADPRQGAPAAWFERPEVRAATGWNEWAGETFVDRDAFEELVGGLAAREVVDGSWDAFALSEALIERVAAAGYRVAAPSGPHVEGGEGSALDEGSLELPPFDEDADGGPIVDPEPADAVPVEDRDGPLGPDEPGPFDEDPGPLPPFEDDPDPTNGSLEEAAPPGDQQPGG